MSQLDTANQLISLDRIAEAQKNLEQTIVHTPLLRNMNYSEAYSANIFFKREDLQLVRSYKLRGAYNKISSLTPAALKRGIACASAGNHAQGVAYSCRKLNIPGKIFMPAPTPSQKIKQVKMFGKEQIEVILEGDTFDDAFEAALLYCEKSGSAFIHPFDDLKVIEGQATVGCEILEDSKDKIDYLFIPVGGGGLAAGVGTVMRHLSPETKVIGVEPFGAPAMKSSLEKGEVITLDKIDKFVDGAALRKVGTKTFKLCKEVLREVALVNEGKVCTTILQLYNEEAIIVEPAGALSIAVLDQYKDLIRGKNVVCIISGGNNDITRTEEIKERSLLYEGLKHYFIIRFAQRAGALREFLTEALGPTDDIVHFEYYKKTNRERGPALVGIEIEAPSDLEALINRMDQKNIVYEYLNDRADLLQFLI